MMIKAFRQFPADIIYLYKIKKISVRVTMWIGIKSRHKYLVSPDTSRCVMIFMNRKQNCSNKYASFTGSRHFLYVQLRPFCTFKFVTFHGYSSGIDISFYWERNVIKRRNNSVSLVRFVSTIIRRLTQLSKLLIILRKGKTTNYNFWLNDPLLHDSFFIIQQNTDV